MLALAPLARAEVLELTTLEMRRSDEGVSLDFAVGFTLPRAVEEALHKGVPLHFVADAAVYRARWWWFDSVISNSTRTWRLIYQPLTLSYRVGFGGFSQTYTRLDEALASVRSSVGWRIADPLPADDDGRYHVHFDYRLDTSQLPRPMQIGIGGRSDWQLIVERTVQLPDAR